MTSPRSFVALRFGILTISDTRTATTDQSGQYLISALKTAGHRLEARTIVPDNLYQIRAIVASWIAAPSVEAIITTGGTGITGRDCTPEAVQPLLDKELPGFGEIFRRISYEEIQTAALQSRALAGVANGTYVFCLPGSKGACRTAWETLIQPQLNAQTSPCNLVDLMPRLQE